MKRSKEFAFMIHFQRRPSLKEMNHGTRTLAPLYHLLRDVAKDFRQKYVQYQPWVLVAVMLWAALHDRPVSWACQQRHWSTTTLKPRRLPSPATMSRRIDSVGV